MYLLVSEQLLDKSNPLLEYLQLLHSFILGITEGIRDSIRIRMRDDFKETIERPEDRLLAAPHVGK
jgi:hypothetical protein